MVLVATVDEVLPLIGGFGLHQAITLAIFCVLTIPSSYQALIIYFVADNPTWRCVVNSTICKLKGEIKSSDKHYEHRCKIERIEWEYTEDQPYSIVTEFNLFCEHENLIFVATSIFFAGMAVGAIAIGWASDKYGRRKVMIPCLLVSMLVAFLSSFSPSYWWFAMSRFIIGLCGPGTVSLFFLVSSEMVSTKHRPGSGIILWFFFTIAVSFQGVLAMYVREWKYLMLYSTAPYLILVPFIFFVPESLRWLHVSNRLDEAQRVMKKVASINGKGDIDIHLSPAKVVHHNVNPMLLFSSWKMTLKSLNIGFAWMVNGLVYYGITLASGDLSGEKYRDYILGSLVEFPAAVIGIFAAMYLGRKRTTQVPMFIGGLFCAAVAGIHELETDSHLRNTRVALGLFGKFFLTMGYDVIYTWTIELYPTQIRTEAMGYVQITSRIGGMLAPWISTWLRKFHWRIPFAVMGILAVVAALLLEWLPETRLLKTAEVLEESGEYGTDQELQPSDGKTNVKV